MSTKRVKQRESNLMNNQQDWAFAQTFNKILHKIRQCKDWCDRPTSQLTELRQHVNGLTVVICTGLFKKTVTFKVKHRPVVRNG